MTQSRNVFLDRQLKLSKMFFDDHYAALKPVLETLAAKHSEKSDCYFVVSKKALDGYVYDDLQDDRLFCEDCIEEAIRTQQEKTEDKITYGIETYYSERYNNAVIKCSGCKTPFNFLYSFNDQMLFNLILNLDKCTEITPEVAWIYKKLLETPKPMPNNLDFRWQNDVVQGESYVAYLKQLTQITQKLMRFLSINLEL
jgi:hypothetical protein